jgi:hypothetical protein
LWARNGAPRQIVPRRHPLNHGDRYARKMLDL